MRTFTGKRFAIKIARFFGSTGITHTHTQTHIEYYTSHEYIERFCSFQFSSYVFPHSFWFVDFPQRRKRKSCLVVPAAWLLAAGVSFGFSFSPPRVCVCGALGYTGAKLNKKIYAFHTPRATFSIRWDARHLDNDGEHWPGWINSSVYVYMCVVGQTL